MRTQQDHRYLSRVGISRKLACGWLAFFICISALPASSSELKLDAIVLSPSAEKVGAKSLDGYSGKPDSQGILAAFLLEIPRIEVMAYYSEPARSWPDGKNQVAPQFIREYSEIDTRSLFALVKLSRPDLPFLALVPLVGTETFTWLDQDDGRLVLKLGTLGSAAVQGDVPLISWAFSDNPYSATRLAWQAGLNSAAVGQSTRMRSDKPYPEIFQFLGWCSWEEFRTDISEEVLVRAVEELEKSSIPVRYLLVDNGHKRWLGDRQLESFVPNEKFPKGWKPLLSLRKPDKIRWMGLWYSFQGSKNGISFHNKLGQKLAPYLAPVELYDMLLPKDDLLSSLAFYNEMVGSAREAGFDFMKIDHQANALEFYRGTPRPVRASVTNSQALEAMAALHLDGLINCMALNSVSVFNTRVSSVTRCSRDYNVGDLDKAKAHLWQSYANALWMGQTVWPDHDMFHSNDPASGKEMAVSKAMSGAPIYLSDNPTQFEADRIMPLCQEDGRLFRPLAPAAPLPDSLFLNPLETAAPYRAIAPLPNGVAAIVVYNLTQPERPVSGTIREEDYSFACGLLQPYPGKWTSSPEGLVLYDAYSKTARKLNGAYNFSLEKYGDRLFLLCPIRHGWAVIGRPDKFLSPAAVEVIDYTDKRLLLRMKEKGPLTLWSERDTVRSELAEFRAVGGGLWRSDLPVDRQDVLLEIVRD